MCLNLLLNSILMAKDWKYNLSLSKYDDADMLNVLKFV